MHAQAVEDAVKVDSDTCSSERSSENGRMQADMAMRITKHHGDSHKIAKMRAAVAYTNLLAKGVARQVVIRATPSALRDEAQEQYASKEQFSPWLGEFFHQHMYRLGLDLFNRVIASAPEATVEVVKRVRMTPGRVRGKLLEPLYNLALTEETQRCLNLSSYNYLGFGGVDEYCTPAAKAAALKYGFNPGAPRTEGGTLPIHRELETEVARFLRKEDAIVIGMGFATNSTILPALLAGTGGHCKGILVISDQLNHKSIVEGVRLSGGTVKAFHHNDMASLEDMLKSAARDGQPGGTPWRKVFVLVEGIYSMEGEFCPLREIVTLKNKYKAYLYIDEAHSIGAVGATGRGVTELLGVPTSEVDVMMGTFTKSFGSAGGYIAASRDVIDALRQSAPGSTFATAMSAPCAAQALTALRVIDGAIGGSVGKYKLASIRDNANFFRQRLIDEGFTVLGDIDSPVIPVMIYHPKKLLRFSRRCLDRKIAVVVVGFPAVPVLEGRARFCVSAAHTREQLDDAVMQLAAVGREVGILYERRSSIQDLASCGSAPRVLKTSEQSASYAAWLRKAPMQRRGEGSVAPEAVALSPEPIAPATASQIERQLGEVRSAALLDVVTASSSCATIDTRLFDALGFVGQPFPEAAEAISKAMDVYGFGACGPRGFYGTSKLHLELEERVAEHLGCDDALMYSAGVATASSVLPALVQPGDHVIVDVDVQLGLRTGLRLCKEALVWWFSSGSSGEVEAALQKAEAKKKQVGKPKKDGACRVFIVVEAISQRSGRLAPVAELLALKEQYGAYLILDETLSFGTLGSTGRGVTEHLGLDIERVDAIIGSFEHAIAGVGGFCAGRKSIVEHQRLSGAGYCFSASCPPSACAAIIAMLDSLASDQGKARISKLEAARKTLHTELHSLVGTMRAPIELVSSPESFVQHIRWTGSAQEGTVFFSSIAKQCANDAGVLIQVCFPTMSATETSINSRLGATSAASPTLRLCATAARTAEQITVSCSVLAAALSAACLARPVKEADL